MISYMPDKLVAILFYYAITQSLHITAIQDEFYNDKANNQGYFR